LTDPTCRRRNTNFMQVTCWNSSLTACSKLALRARGYQKREEFGVGRLREVAAAGAGGARESVVFGVALRVTTDRHAAEEITQAVFLDPWRCPQRFDPKRGPLRPWLATVAHHRGVDWMRREQAGRRRDLDAGRAHMAPLPDIGEAVEAVLMAERVRLAVAALPEEERVPICLAYFGDRNYRQVAEDLNIPEGTIKSRIRAGLARMAKALHSEVVGLRT
jgi:RNA polymerase sigma factor (sigma-70 family)